MRMTSSHKNIYLYVTPFFPSSGRHFGSYSYDFVQALKRHSDYDVRVFVPGDGPDYDFDGCHVNHFPTKQLPSAILPLLFTRWNQRSFIKKLNSLGIDLKDVAVCHGNTAQFAIYPLAIKKFNSACKTLLHHHDLASVGLRMGILRHCWLHKAICYLWYRRLFEQIDLHVFISESCKRSFLSFPDTRWTVFKDYRKLGRGMGFFRPVRIKAGTILWNGVDKGLFGMANRGEGERRMGDPFVIGCIGNFIEVKDQLGLVKAVAQLKDQISGLQLEFLGDNGYAAVLEPVKRYIAEHHLEKSVRILPCVPHHELPKAYRHWDLFVLPSFFEGLGCVYLESWACGTPFIGCKGQGIEDCVPEEDKEKWLARPLDVHDLAKKIMAYYTNRYEQKLKGPVDIDVIVSRFVRELEDLKP